MEIKTTDLSFSRNFRLHDSGQALMFDIAKRVRSGYRWWAVGEITAEKIMGFVAKMQRLYDVGASSLVRHRRKSGGIASTTLFVWPLRNDPAGYTTRFGYLLLSSEHLDGEVMYDGRKKPIRLALYANSHAVFHLMPAEKRKERGADLKWTYTWQLRAESLKLMQERFAASVGVPADLDRLRSAYSNLPMVAGYRAQFKDVLAQTRPLWKRASTPMVMAAKKEIKAGLRPDPFSLVGLPFIHGFPKLYADPPITLGMYLDATLEERRAQKRRTQMQSRADHHQPGV